MSPAAGPAGPLLAVDAGSPVVSVAVGGEQLLAEAREPLERSSALLLPMIDAVLARAGLEPGDVRGLVGVRGPGSFTGLRVGLATVLGLHQALGLPAAAVSTLEVLATLAAGEGATAVAAVDALRGEWFTQPFRSGALPEPLAPPRIVPSARLAELAPCRLIGFGVTAIGGLADAGVEVLEPAALAGPAVRLAARGGASWNAADLIEPLYLRPPATTTPSS